MEEWGFLLRGVLIQVVVFGGLAAILYWKPHWLGSWRGGEEPED